MDLATGMGWLTASVTPSWAIVWVIVAAAGGLKRQMVTVDELGRISYQRI